MAQRVNTPSDIRIASLERKAAVYRNPMEMGPGVPWEDRGSGGAILAYLRTALRSLFSPVRLFNSIRRPENTADANAFLFFNGIICGISTLIHNFIFAWQYQQEPYTHIATGVYWTGAALQFVLAPAVLFGLVKILATLHYKLTANEMKTAKPSLTFNVMAYATGPAILSLIPIAGPPLALFWCVILIIIAGRSRLQLTVASAIVCALMAIVAIAAIAAAGYFAMNFIWQNLTDGGVVITPPKKDSGAFR